MGCCDRYRNRQGKGSIGNESRAERFGPQMFERFRRVLLLGLGGLVLYAAYYTFVAGR